MTIDTQRLATDPDYWDEVAPNGANRFFNGQFYQCFLKYSDPENLYFLDGGEWHNIALENIGAHIEKSFPRPCRRPKTAPEEWVDGLPSVGEKVEVWISNVEYWAQVSVLAVDVDTVIWRNGTDRASYIGTHIDNVRPIPTKQERQRDELRKTLLPLIGVDNHKTVSEVEDAIWSRFLSRYNLEPKR